MKKYRLIHRKPFESLPKYEARLNEECARDWRIINITGQGSMLTALLEREQRH